jgi:glutamyl-tRNA synthetase
MIDDALAAPTGRLAPSPTGAQHVGNARTYLIAWLSARARGGRVLLRIEDIDSPRTKPGATKSAFEDLRWLGLDWDGDVAVQSSRMDLYTEALRLLQSREMVYPCTCSRSDVEQAASAPHADHEVPFYPGTCASRRASEAAALGNRPYCWRFRLTGESPAFDDLYRGPTSLDLRQCGGDFVVWKMPGAPGGSSGPAYQLAVVVDDAAQGVTEVVRADDLIPSTPRQLLLYRALDLKPPRFCHVPLVVGPDGRRLAKRHGDTRLVALRDAGVRPEALLGLLAWSCGWLGDMRPVTACEQLSRFQLGTISPDPFVLTPALLHRIGYG